MDSLQAWDGPLARYVHWANSCASTNSLAISASDCLPTDQLPMLVVAHEQTAGRGRSGRSWLADRGTLAFSLLDSRQRLPLEPAQLPLVALATGLAIAEALEAFAPPTKAWIKWPNDIYIDGGKVAGVLVESASHQGMRFVIGIGINVSTRLESFPVEVRDRARCLSEVTGRTLQRFDLLPLVLERLEEHLTSFSPTKQGDYSTAAATFSLHAGW